MPKLMLHNSSARRALAIGVSKLAAAVEPTLGPLGMNAMIYRPIGTPMVTPLIVSGSGSGPAIK